MSYKLRRSHPAPKEFRRILHEQIDKALEQVDEARKDPVHLDDAIHDLRKRCKKIRGLMRIYRQPLGDQYKAENARFRDLAKAFSNIRDAEALTEALELLEKVSSDDAAWRASKATLDDALRLHRRGVGYGSQGHKQLLNVAVDELRKARREGPDLPKQADRISFDYIAGSMAKTYRRGRKATKKALQDPTAENLHELRKRTKYHWHHLRLIQNAWPNVVKGRKKEVKRLSDLLGDDRDLMLLNTFLWRRAILTPVQRDQVSQEISRQRYELQCEALRLARLVYLEKSDRLMVRFRRYWQIHSRDRPAGGIRTDPVPESPESSFGISAEL